MATAVIRIGRKTRLIVAIMRPSLNDQQDHDTDFVRHRFTNQ